MRIQEHNNLIKVCFDGNKHLKHVMTDSQIKNMCMIENRYPLTKLPVCGGCERLAMWSRGKQATCTHCGTITKSPITYSSYLASGYDIDPTGDTAKRVLNLEKEKMKRQLILPDYGG